jgi:hypothetical protein
MKNWSLSFKGAMGSVTGKTIQCRFIDLEQSGLRALFSRLDEAKRIEIQ